MANWPVTFAAGAFACSHCLKSLRSNESCARYDFTVLLEKSIFLPAGGFVLTYVESGSPFSWTMALSESTAGLGVPEESETLPEPATAALVTSAATSAATARRPVNLRTVFLPYSFRPQPRAPVRRGAAGIVPALSGETARPAEDRQNGPSRRRRERHDLEPRRGLDVGRRRLRRIDREGAADDREAEHRHRLALGNLFRVLSLELLVCEGFVLLLFAHGVRLPATGATKTAQPCGFAIVR